MQRTIDFYKLNKQRGQPVHIEVWTEKDAISGILKSVTNKYTVMMAVNKGYTSSTAIYNAYERFVESIEQGKKIKILYFGDHDPSGLDMIRDIKNRLEFMFVNGDQLSDMAERHYEKEGYDLTDIYNIGEPYDEMDVDGDDDKWVELFEQGKVRLMLRDLDCFEIIQIGLTMEQIKEYNPPHNPAKMTDPRAKWYIEKFGAVSWEVDALNPNLMRSIVKASILDNMDDGIYQAVLNRQDKDIYEIKGMIGTNEE